MQRNQFYLGRWVTTLIRLRRRVENPTSIAAASIRQLAYKGVPPTSGPPTPCPRGGLPCRSRETENPLSPRFWGFFAFQAARLNGPTRGGFYRLARGHRGFRGGRAQENL